MTSSAVHLVSSGCGFVLSEMGRKGLEVMGGPPGDNVSSSLDSDLRRLRLKMWSSSLRAVER